MSEWISVDDMYKPSNFQKVLIYTLDADSMMVITTAIFNGSRGFLLAGGCKDNDVTHWMPLPEPPNKS